MTHRDIAFEKNRKEKTVSVLRTTYLEGEEIWHTKKDQRKMERA